MTTTTDTPRTDAHHWEAGRNLHPFQYAPLLSFARELERELKDAQEAYLKSVERDDYLTQGLAASQAEVERLDHLLADASETNHKLAAEVERLDQMVEWFIENAPHFTLAQFNEHQRTLNSTDE